MQEAIVRDRLLKMMQTKRNEVDQIEVTSLYFLLAFCTNNVTSLVDTGSKGDHRSDRVCFKHQN